MSIKLKALNFYIVIPAHNEQDSIGLTLDSLVRQTLLPKQIVLVNDNSTDGTQDIIDSYTSKYPWIQLVNTKSSNEHLPGAKIINAFYKGFEVLDNNYDVICKFDADLIFPHNYLEQISKHFNSNTRLGMVSGFCFIEKNGQWVLENLTNKDHIRGALKTYRKDCFIQIGKLKPSMGWDTVDELLAKYYKWTILTDETLHVKHLKPTGISYNEASKHLQGEAMYKMRYGIILGILTGLKMAWGKKSLSYFFDYTLGYLKALFNKTDYIVTKEQGKFIRHYRWIGIRSKFF